MKLNEKLATIQTKFKSKKSRFNSFGKYYFRSAEDILEATKPFLLELGVSVTINEKLTVQDPPILSTTATISDGENQITATAVVGVDLAQKGMQTPHITLPQHIAANALNVQAVTHKCKHIETTMRTHVAKACA